MWYTREAGCEASPTWWSGQRVEQVFVFVWRLMVSEETPEKRCDMSVSVDIQLDTNDAEEFESRAFESLPRVDEFVMFRPSWDKQQVGSATCRVVAVYHELAVHALNTPTTLSAHGRIVVTPISDEDRARLRALYPPDTDDDDEG